MNTDNKSISNYEIANQLIKQGFYSSALELISKNIPSNSPYLNEFLLLSGRISRSNTDELSGIKPLEQITIEKNRHAKSVLDLAKKILQKDLTNPSLKQENTIRIELKIEGSFSDLSANRKDEIIQILINSLDLGIHEVKLGTIREGSIIIPISLPYEGYSILREKIQMGEFKELHIITITEVYELKNKSFKLIQNSKPDLSMANLMKIDFRASNLKGANLHGTNFKYSSLVKVNLQGTHNSVPKSSHIQEFINSKLGPDFDYADLRNTIIIDANLKRSSFRHANMQGADLSKSNFLLSDFSQADLRNVNFNSSNLSHADFFRSNLQKVIFSDSYLIGANFKEVNLSNTNLQHVNFFGLNCQNADFRNSSLQHSSFQGADLKGAKISNADFQYSDLRESDLRHIDFSNSKLNNAKTSSAVAFFSQKEDLEKSGADVSEIKFISRKGEKEKIRIPY